MRFDAKVVELKFTRDRKGMPRFTDDKNEQTKEWGISREPTNA